MTLFRHLIGYHIGGIFPHFTQKPTQTHHISHLFQDTLVVLSKQNKNLKVVEEEYFSAHLLHSHAGVVLHDDWQNTTTL